MGMKITKQNYVDYLLATPANYTCTNLADHLDTVSHDAVSDYLKRERHTARTLWELARSLIDDVWEAFLIFDDSGQDKRYSQKRDLVKRQYRGAGHGLVRGIGVVNLVQSTGKDGDFYPIDYRIYAPENDGKTKNDPFQEMLIAAVADKQLQAHTILFDTWYASAENLKVIHRLGRVFFTTVKSNRRVSVSKEAGYIGWEDVDWTPERLASGVVVRLQKVPFPVRLFKLVATNGDIDWVMTNDLDSTVTSLVAQDANDVRWDVEELHRGLKQLTGSAKCQCRTGRSQRTHLACCYHAWLSLKGKAKELGKTRYQVRADVFRDYLRAELRNPHIPAL
jgi:hypothetical protein